MFTLRPYQSEAVEAAVRYMTASPTKRNGIIVVPTGGGKSLIISEIAHRLKQPVLVLQPSKEILIQNYLKMQAYNVPCAMYSASVGSKQIGWVTFATIGSIKAHKEQFFKFRYVLIDECHLVNPTEGMYKSFIDASRCKVLGLTATPYRLYSSRFYGSMLKFITRSRPRIFDDLVYSVQVQELSNNGFLAPLDYYCLDVVDQRKMIPSGIGFTERSEKAHYKEIKYREQLVSIIQRLRTAGRDSILVFTRYTEEASAIVQMLGNEARMVSADTPSQERDSILMRFKAGKIKVVANVGILTTGFDYPQLSTVVLARPTRSLSLYYQMVGRAIRPYEGKRKWVIDVCGNVKRFGKVEDLWIDNNSGLPCVRSRGRQLTNVWFT